MADSSFARLTAKCFLVSILTLFATFQLCLFAPLSVQWNRGVVLLGILSWLLNGMVFLHVLLLKPRPRKVRKRWGIPASRSSSSSPRGRQRARTPSTNPVSHWFDRLPNTWPRPTLPSLLHNRVGQLDGPGSTRAGLSSKGKKNRNPIDPTTGRPRRGRPRKQSNSPQTPVPPPLPDPPRRPVQPQEEEEDRLERVTIDGLVVTPYVGPLRVEEPDDILNRSPEQIQTFYRDELKRLQREAGYRELAIEVREQQKGKKRVDDVKQQRMDHQLDMTSAEMKHLIQSTQIRSDLLNVLPVKPNQKRTPKKLKTTYLRDSQFRDTQGNHINAGQLFRFIHHQFRVFISECVPEFSPRPCPLKPDWGTIEKKACTELVVMVGIANDRTPPRFHGDSTVVLRAGKPVYFRARPSATMAPGGPGEFVCLGSHIEKANIWFYQGYSLDHDWALLHREMITNNGAELHILREQFNIDLKQWVEDRKNWEWEIFQAFQAKEIQWREELEAGFEGELPRGPDEWEPGEPRPLFRWPQGTTLFDITEATRETVMSPVELQSHMPSIPINVKAAKELEDMLGDGGNE